jgi:YihY family inner membrane protein
MPDWKAQLEALRDWLRTPPSDLSGKQRTIRWWVDMSRHCVTELRLDRASQMAAALTYHTLFSLLPTVVLSLVVLHAFVGEADREQLKRDAISWVLTPLQQEAPIVGPMDQPETDRRQQFEEVRRSLSDRVGSVIDSLESVNFGGIGVVGVLIFLYAATGLLSTIERSFNTVYKAASARSIHIRVPIYYTVITVGPIVLVAGQWLQRRLVQAIAAETWSSWLLTVFAVAAPLVTTWLVLWLLYSLLPNTHVSVRLAAVGSAVSAVLWAAGVQLFTIYVQRAAVSTLYGALGLLPLALFWMWLTWLIVLFGLELTYSLQSMRDGRFRYGYHRERAQTMVDRTLLLPLAARIAQRFAEGKLATIGDLSETMRIPERTIENMIDVLEDAKIVYRVQDGRMTGYTLSQPAEEISAAQVLAASEELLPSMEGTPLGHVWEFVDQLQKDLKETTRSTSLAQLK